MSASAAVIGAGPAGLMAAEVMAREGLAVTVYDHMPTPGRKFLLAGRGGLNLTHSEDLPRFLSRYGKAEPHLRTAIEAFPPPALIAWCEGLGQPTFVGTSGRVFPRSMKASPLLRAWLGRLRSLNVTFQPRHRWLGWTRKTDCNSKHRMAASPSQPMPQFSPLAAQAGHGLAPMVIGQTLSRMRASPSPA